MPLVLGHCLDRACPTKGRNSTAFNDCSLCTHAQYLLARKAARNIEGSAHANKDDGTEACLGGGEPPGEPAKVPLGADVGPRAQQHIEALLLSERQVSLQVSKAIPVVLPWEGFVQVPGHVHLCNT